LPEKLLREAARIISREGVKALSMRRLSERLGTSRMAAYHHFAGKAELLSAVGQDGFRRLGTRLRAASLVSGSPREKLEAALLAYVRFAIEETEFFRLMFGRLLKRPVKANGDPALNGLTFSSPEALQTFSALTTTIQEAQNAGQIRSGDPLVIANTLWAFTHGTAVLVMDNHWKSPLRSDEYFRQSLDLVFRGLNPERQ
jgi:AcrR family transcriptional regulator